LSFITALFLFFSCEREIQPADSLYASRKDKEREKICHENFKLVEEEDEDAGSYVT
jgi:hypothetical protein